MNGRAGEGEKLSKFILASFDGGVYMHCFLKFIHTYLRECKSTYSRVRESKWEREHKAGEIELYGGRHILIFFTTLLVHSSLAIKKNK